MIDLALYRVRIGLFSGHGHWKSGNNCTKFSYYFDNIYVENRSMSARHVFVVILLILLIGCIELNPGPFTRSPIKAKVTPKTATPESVRKNLNGNLGKSLINPQTVRLPTTPPFSESYTTTPFSVGDSSKKQCLEGAAAIATTSSTTMTKTTTMDDLRNLLIAQGMENKTQFGAIAAEFKSIRLDLNAKLSNLEKENKELKQEVQRLNKKVSTLSGAIIHVQQDLEKQENYSKKNNLIFRNIPNDDKKDSITLVEEMMGRVFGTTINRDQIAACHFLPSAGSVKPILLKFVSLIEKERIWRLFSEFRRTNQIGPSDFRVTQHFAESTRMSRQRLYPFLMTAIKENKKATFDGSNLRIEGITYAYEPVTKGLVRVKGMERSLSQRTYTTPEHSPMTIDLTPANQSPGGSHHSGQ